MDLVASKGNRTVTIQVKSYNTYGWISGGGVNPLVCSGGSLFNKAAAASQCEFVICPTPSRPGDRMTLAGAWRFFVMPVKVADALFRINIDAYFNGLKRDGTPRAKSGAVQDWVGPGPLKSRMIPDHQQDYWPFENLFSILES